MKVKDDVKVIQPWHYNIYHPDKTQDTQKIEEKDQKRLQTLSAAAGIITDKMLVFTN